jgi:hypothetical protein
MGLMTHPCRECGEDRLFDQPHDAGQCFDEGQGDCPEWACTGCGAALIMGFPGLIAGQISAAGQRPRQAA